MDIFLLIATGVAGGVLAGMGMGGGTLLIPLLTWVCGMEQHAAQAVNLVAFIPMAVITLIIHIKNKLVDFKDVLYLIIPATAVSVLAAIFVKRVDSELLKMLFGGFLILLGIYQFYSAVKCMKESAKKKKAKAAGGAGITAQDMLESDYPVKNPAAENPLKEKVKK